jgi:chloride channel protein, CIC family
VSPAEKPDLPFARIAKSAEFGHITKWVLLSAVIGLFGGLAAAGFKWLTEFMSELLFYGPTEIVGEGASDWTSKTWLLLLIPTLGGLLVGWLIDTFAPEAEGHGTDSVIRSFHRLRGAVRKRVIFLKALTSAITIGSGGSAGQEGPVAQVGAGVGSTLSHALKLSSRDRRVFLLAGASAGVGAMFGAPLGGALFMPEVLYKKPEFEGEAIIPCIISSICAYTTFTAIQGGEHLAVDISAIPAESLRFEDPRELLIYLVLGIACAVFGLLYTKVFYGVHTAAGKMKHIPKAVRPAIGGFMLGAVALAILPYASGNGILFGGYGLMQTAITSTDIPIMVLVLLILAKILATSFTIGSGGSGGVFAPALAIGALIGALVGQTADAWFPGLAIEPACFALVGMGGFFAGVAKVPIASVIMVSEMTGSYALLAPLMLVAVVHMLLSSGWTMYEAQVKSQVDSPAHAGDFVINVLESIGVRDIVGENEHSPHLIEEGVTLRSAMRIVSDSHETHFPVVDKDERLVGIFSLTDLRRIMLEEVALDVIIVRDFMVEKVVTVRMEDSGSEALRKMNRFNITAIPVVDSEEPWRIVALLDRNALGRAYDARLTDLRSDSGHG